MSLFVSQKLMEFTQKKKKEEEEENKYTRWWLSNDMVEPPRHRQDKSNKTTSSRQLWFNHLSLSLSLSLFLASQTQVSHFSSFDCVMQLVFKVHVPLLSQCFNMKLIGVFIWHVCIVQGVNWLIKKFRWCLGHQFEVQMVLLRRFASNCKSLEWCKLLV